MPGFGVGGEEDVDGGDDESKEKLRSNMQPERKDDNAKGNEKDGGARAHPEMHTDLTKRRQWEDKQKEKGEGSTSTPTMTEGSATTEGDNAEEEKEKKKGNMRGTDVTPKVGSGPWNNRKNGLTITPENPSSIDGAVPTFDPNKCSSGNYRYKSLRFKVGRRHDFQGSINDGLGALGMCRVKEKKTGYDVYWDKTFDIFGDEEEKERYRSERIKDDALVSSIPGVRESIGLKPSLARVHDACLRRHRGKGEVICSFTKKAFNFERTRWELKIEGGIKPFVDYVYGLVKKYDEQQWPQLWIFKPQKSFLGRGIKMMKVEREDVNDIHGIANWAGKMFPNGNWTMQEYVRNPAVYKGRKFDVRAWSVLASLDPLRIYVLKHGFAKISTVDYTPSIESMQDICMHVKMPLGPGCEANKLVHPYPKSTDERNFEEHLNFKKVRRDVEWSTDIWQQVEDQVAITILSGLSNVKAAEWEIFDGDRDAMRRYRRFVFLSPDFAFDSQGKVWMEEMNTNGFMIGDTYANFFPAQHSTIQVMQLLGADKYPNRWKYEKGAKAVIEKFCNSNPGGCNAEDREELERMIHEEMHSHVAWSRTWPPRENQWPGMKKVREFWNKYANLIKAKGSREAHEDGEPTKLDVLTWKFIEFRWRNTIGGKGDEKTKKLITETCIYCKGDVGGEKKGMHRQWWE